MIILFEVKIKLRKRKQSQINLVWIRLRQTFSGKNVMMYSLLIFRFFLFTAINTSLFNVYLILLLSYTVLTFQFLEQHCINNFVMLVLCDKTYEYIMWKITIQYVLNCIQLKLIHMILCWSRGSGLCYITYINTYKYTCSHMCMYIYNV